MVTRLLVSDNRAVYFLPKVSEGEVGQEESYTTLYSQVDGRESRAH